MPARYAHQVIVYVVSDLRDCPRLEVENTSTRKALVDTVQLRSHEELAVLWDSCREHFVTCERTSAHLSISVNVFLLWIVALCICLVVLLEIFLLHGEEPLEQESLWHYEMS